MNNLNDYAKSNRFGFHSAMLEGKKKLDNGQKVAVVENGRYTGLQFDFHKYLEFCGFEIVSSNDYQTEIKYKNEEF